MRWIRKNRIRVINGRVARVMHFRVVMHRVIAHCVSAHLPSANNLFLPSRTQSGYNKFPFGDCQRNCTSDPVSKQKRAVPRCLHVSNGPCGSEMVRARVASDENRWALLAAPISSSRSMLVRGQNQIRFIMDICSAARRRRQGGQTYNAPR